MPQRKTRAFSSWLIAVIAIAAILAIAMFLPNIMNWFTRKYGTKDMNGLRTICTANVSYEYGHPKVGYARALKDLGPDDGNYIDGVLASGVKSGYRYEYLAITVTSGRIEHYRATARPEHFGSGGVRSFYMDESCEIHWTDENRPATPADPKQQ
jgi:hypothetical protein